MERNVTYEEGVRWIGERRIQVVSPRRPEFEIMLDLWKRDLPSFAPPREVERHELTVTAVQEIELLEEPVLIVHFYSIEEWEKGEQPNLKYSFFLAGEGFFDQLDLAREWGLRL